jgi:hypothetical protein
MTGTTVLFDHADTVIPLTQSFSTSNNTLTAPAAVVCVVTDPTGTATTYTYAGSSTPGTGYIYSTVTGKYELDLQPFSVGSPPPPGLWHATWIGSGGSVALGAQVFTPSFRVYGLKELGGQQTWYTSIEELKSRLGGTYANPSSISNDDYELTTAIMIASRSINRFCGTHFNRITEARTFAVENLYFLKIDQLVKGSITSFLLDIDGDGTFETAWTEGNNYQALREGHGYNVNDIGTPQPQNLIQVILGTPTTVGGGQFLPFVWPFTHEDRVQITATWGWPEIPAEVSQACLLMATDYFKSKDAPFGMAGQGDLAFRVQQSPWVVDLLRPFIFSRKKVAM